MTAPVVPVVPGPYDIQPPRKTDGCAACGAAPGREGVALRVESVDRHRMTLCTNVRACTARYRGGLQPAGYAAMVARGEKP